MPKDPNIKKVMILGAGPIVIGQACEFDYSGVQGVKALKEEGIEVVLVNSNPATIMTDPNLADRTYIEPLLPEFVARILERERPDALLPTLGGQTALNLAMALAQAGLLEKLSVRLIGASATAIAKAEDRKLFKEAIGKIGLQVARSVLTHSEAEAMRALDIIDFPAILRPAFTLGGTGGSVANNLAEYQKFVRLGLDASPIRQLLVEQSLLGWKEFELEVMRDKKDNVVIVCSIENFDPMGVHTGDSITVAPAQTLTDKEYQLMRDAAIAIIREIGVDTGGSNIQFAVNPDTGEMMVIEMNPRVSRSSALASKATGFPIAKFATKLAIGYTLDEIANDITKYTPASFEPTLDYVVTKIPRFTFEKFSQAEDILTTQMKSVGEVMAIGRTFKESLHKAIRSLEISKYGFESVADLSADPEVRKKQLADALKVPRSGRLWAIAEALRAGMSVTEIHRLSWIDPWFLHHIAEIVVAEDRIQQLDLNALDAPAWYRLKGLGFSDRRLAQLTGAPETEVRTLRLAKNVRAAYKMVDTCGAEFEAHTPYLYSTYDNENEAVPSDRDKIIILGGGPNRIGQGIEFDYCCCHAAFAVRECGLESIMVNCNPETVSTDYDTSDRLYFEPLTLEDVLRIVELEKPRGVIVQFGGQTPLKLAVPLEREGVPILGTTPDAIDLAEDRRRFKDFLQRLNLLQPPNGIATSTAAACAIAQKIGYPVLVRPSYVLGGRAMEIVYHEDQLDHYMQHAVQASEDRPVLIDAFIEGAIEVDVDAVCDGTAVVVGGVMEHIEHAGIHSGDSACCLPPYSLSPAIISAIVQQTKLMALKLGVKGLMNVQYAVLGEKIYILEVNPRASRTVPFVSKAIGVPLAKIATKVMLGKSLQELGFTHEIIPPYLSVKEAVLPFEKFPGVDTLLGPEMKSTGEVMGIDKDFGAAFAKSQLAAGTLLPTCGTVFISVRDKDKKAIIAVAKELSAAGFYLLATRGTAAILSQHGLAVQTVNKVHEGSPHIVEEIEAGRLSMMINTHEGMLTAKDSYHIRRAALTRKVPYFTTLAAAKAVAAAVAAMQQKNFGLAALQELHRF